MEQIKTITIRDNEDFLRQVSTPVVFPDNELKENIQLLEQYFNQSDITLALAAVQLGIPKRLIYLKNTNLELLNRKNNNLATEEDKLYNEHRVLINPIIISREGLTEYWEVCASCLDNVGHVQRPYKITVEYQDINGNHYSEVFEGFESTVLSHEMDHLDGILHIDIADEILHIPREERKEFRKTHGYDIVSKAGDFNELLKDLKAKRKIKE
ncbi:MAG: peptide deformylase [Bacilli bacterium]|nr:peptide deformylase [Bacilli bacterium]